MGSGGGMLPGQASGFGNVVRKDGKEVIIICGGGNVHFDAKAYSG